MDRKYMLGFLLLLLATTAVRCMDEVRYAHGRLEDTDTAQQQPSTTALCSSRSTTMKRRQATMPSSS